MKQFVTSPDDLPNDATLSTTSTGLLRAAQLKSEDAWQQLVLRYSRSVYRWARRSGLQPADAANIMQDTLRSVAEHITQFRPGKDGGTFRGWLRRICQNKVRDYYRAAKKSPDRPSGGDIARVFLDSLAADEEISRSEPLAPPASFDKQAVERVRAAVSSRDWTIFWRVVVDGQGAAEVAKDFGVTANTVRIVKTRMLRKLRQELRVAPKQLDDSAPVRIDTD